VLLLIVAMMFAILYYAAPNVRQGGIGAVMPGGILAVVPSAKSWTNVGRRFVHAGDIHLRRSKHPPGPCGLKRLLVCHESTTMRSLELRC
jgi:hypothetical protein